MSQWETDREYLEHKFTDPEFYHDSPGMPLPELKTRLAEHFEKNNHLPHALIKA
jgi:hypothetical protein